jgi:hypothetical protein
VSYIFKPLLLLYFTYSTLLNQLNNTKISVLRKYSHNKISLNYRILKNKYGAFDSITREKINDYDM